MLQITLLPQKIVFLNLNLKVVLMILTGLKTGKKINIIFPMSCFHETILISKIKLYNVKNYHLQLTGLIQYCELLCCFFCSEVGCSLTTGLPLLVNVWAQAKCWQMMVNHAWTVPDCKKRLGVGQLVTLPVLCVISGKCFHSCLRFCNFHRWLGEVWGSHTLIAEILTGFVCDF